MWARLNLQRMRDGAGIRDGMRSSPRDREVRDSILHRLIMMGFHQFYIKGDFS